MFSPDGMTSQQFTYAVLESIRKVVEEQNLTHPEDVMSTILSHVEAIFTLTTVMPFNAWNLKQVT